MTDIDYAGIICIPPKDESIRFVLKKEGNKSLYIIGLNASAADENKPDPTVRRAMGIAVANGFDGFVMFNLYPLRATDPKDLPEADEQKLVKRNITAIKQELGGVSQPTIVAAWGDNITKRAYFGECLQSIIRSIAAQGATWKRIGDLTKAGHPRHPLYVEGSAELSNFDVEKYITTLK